MPTPKLIVPEGIWNQLVEEAKTSDGTLKAFGLFSERRTASRRDYVVKDFMRISVEVIKEKSASGPIFRFRNMKDKGFYLSGKKSLRYCGTAMIQRNLDMTLHYAFWMGREQIDVNVSIFFDKSKNEAVYKAYWVSLNSTDGEFVPIDVVISKESNDRQISTYA